jgi:hypothetical protein
VFGTIFIDSDLSDSSTGWVGYVSGTGATTPVTNNLDKQAGTCSITVSGTPADEGGMSYAWLSRELPVSAQFTKNDLNSINIDFKVMTTGSWGAPRVYLYDAGYQMVAEKSDWGQSDNYTSYWGTGLNKASFDWTAGKEDTKVTNIRIAAEWTGNVPTTIFADNLSLDFVPEPTTLVMLCASGLMFMRRKIA